MKDYSLKINGNQYDISIEDVNEESTMANVTVNGVAYEVKSSAKEDSKMKKPQVVPAPKACRAVGDSTTAAPSAPKACTGCCRRSRFAGEISAARYDPLSQCEGATRRLVKLFFSCSRR